jgi:hypothetical protein
LPGEQELSSLSEDKKSRGTEGRQTNIEPLLFGELSWLSMTKVIGEKGQERGV